MHSSTNPVLTTALKVWRVDRLAEVFRPSVALLPPLGRADVRARTHGRKAYRHPLVGLLELHQENFVLPDESGVELLVLSAAPGSSAEDRLRLLAGLARTAATRIPE